MPPTCIYNPSDAAVLGARVEQMMAEAEDLKANHVAPTKKERYAIFLTVLELVRTRGRKIYGGHALNAALMQKNIRPIYTGLAGEDVEFYSPDPIADIKELCDRLYVNNHRYVQGKEAQHHGTFTISVQFTRVCDVSFVPQRVFDAIPTFAMGDNMMGVTPSHALIDHLRILTDPFTSYWKLDKQLPRMLQIQEHFPLDLPPPNLKKKSSSSTSLPPPHESIVISKWAASRTSVASVGDHAVAFYARLIDTVEVPRVRHITMVSADYANDLYSLNQMLGMLGKATEHYPFVDMLGARTIFRNAEGAPIATLIDSRGKAIPTVGTDPVDGILVASLTYSLMTSLVMRFLALTENRNAVAQVHAHIAANLIELRKMASSSYPFRDVNLFYLGEPRSDMSIHMEMTDERRIRSPPGAMIWFKYDPNGNPRRRRNNNAPPPIQNFVARCDGHYIVSQKDSFLAKMRAELDLKVLITSSSSLMTLDQSATLTTTTTHNDLRVL